MSNLPRQFTLAMIAYATVSVGTAHAQDEWSPPASGIELHGRYIADVVHVVKGSDSPRTYLLHDADVSADFDFGRLAGADGLKAGVHVLATAGGRPNDAAGTVQGIDNIEVASHRLKLYEAWLEKTFASGRLSVRAGLSDLNADFYQNDSSGLLVAPAFGIGSELAATGPNGPSIFPSTALTARVALQLGQSGYAKIAIVDAKAGVIGDPNGIDFTMRDGALAIAEVGTTASGKFALGIWQYTHKQDDIRAVQADGTPVKRVARGVYFLADHRLAGGDDNATNLFLRVGISEGKTTPFRGGFQAGVLRKAPFAGRPEGQISFGIQQGLLSRGFREALEDEGAAVRRAEYGVELTYSDKLMPWVSVQPDFQYVRRPYGDGSRGTVIVGMRVTFATP